MLLPTQNLRIFIATTPVDFRKGMDGLAAYVADTFDLDPFSGALFLFRSKAGDKIKVLAWDGTGLVLVYKRLHGKRFVWPNVAGGMISIGRTQFEALFEGIDWRRVTPAVVSKPKIV